MRFHVLGVGSIGSLIAFHLKRSIKLQRNQLYPTSSSSSSSSSSVSSRHDLLLSSLSNKRPSKHGSLVSTLSIPKYLAPHLPDPTTSSVTLHLQNRLFVKQAKNRYYNSIVAERNGVRDIEGGFQVEFTGGPGDVVSSLVRDTEKSSGRFTISRSASSTSSSSSGASTIPAQPGRSTAPFPDQDRGVSVISTMLGESGPPGTGPIDSLIVTTKCDSTLAALNNLRHRIHPWTTIVLIQNGMGVMDTIVDKLFQDPEKRPNFVLASTTHGCWRRGPLDTVHASFGSLHFGVVPNPRAGIQGFETRRVPLSLAQPLLNPLSSKSQSISKPRARGWEAFAPLPQDLTSSSSSNSKMVDIDPTAPSDLFSVEGIPDVPSLKTLKWTLSTLLSLPLQVQWESIQEFQLRAIRKLAVNACINPLTALADCKNGDLYGNPAALDVIWSICLEASAVLEAQVREYLENQQQQQQDEKDSTTTTTTTTRSISSLSTSDLIIQSSKTGLPILDPSLTATSLYNEVIRVIRSTASNWSSMHSDIKNGRSSTEIDFINGYLSALGRGYGVDTNSNDLVTNLIKLKVSRVTGTGKL